MSSEKFRVTMLVRSVDRVMPQEAALAPVAWKKKRTERNVTRPAQLGNNRGDRIRTYGPLYPKQMRYQTALHLVGPVMAYYECFSFLIRFAYAYILPLLHSKDPIVGGPHSSCRKGPAGLSCLREGEEAGSPPSCLRVFSFMPTGRV